jgi:hypothetical protein
MSSEIYIGMRFIIGKLFPRPYKLIGMDEYYGTDKVSFTLEIDKIDHGDSIEKGIAFNNLHK